MTSYAIWALNFKSDVRFGLRGHSEVGKARFIFTLKNPDVLNLLTMSKMAKIKFQKIPLSMAAAGLLGPDLVYLLPGLPD